MTEAVIVATARSPIGRAFKGSLTTVRPDDLTCQMVRTALAKLPQLDPADIGARHHAQPLLLVLAADHPDGVPRHQGR